LLAGTSTSLASRVVQQQCEHVSVAAGAGMRQSLQEQTACGERDRSMRQRAGFMVALAHRRAAVVAGEDW
jgi:hypothetical protein